MAELDSNLSLSTTVNRSRLEAPYVRGHPHYHHGLVYSRSDYFHPYLPSSSHLHPPEGDCSIFLTGLLTCTCTLQSLIHWDTQAIFIKPTTDLSHFCSKSCNGSILPRIKSKVLTMAHEALQIWLLAALLLPWPIPNSLDSQLFPDAANALRAFALAVSSVWIDLPPDTQKAYSLTFFQSMIKSYQQTSLSTLFIFFDFLFLWNFKGYFPFTVIKKYWLYSPCCIIHPWTYLTPNSLYLPLSHPYTVPPPPPHW